MKKIAGTQDVLKTVYKEPKETKEGDNQEEKKHYKKKEYDSNRFKEEWKPREKKKDEPDVDSDGFEIVGSKKTSTVEYRPKKNYGDYNDNRGYKKRGGYRGDRGGKFENKGERKNTNTEEKENVDKDNEEITNEEQKDLRKEPEKKVKGDIVTVKVDSKAKKLGDLFD